MVCSDYSGMPLLGMWPEIDDQLSRSTGNQENRAVQVAEIQIKYDYNMLWTLPWIIMNCQNYSKMIRNDVVT